MPATPRLRSLLLAVALHAVAHGSEDPPRASPNPSPVQDDEPPAIDLTALSLEELMNVDVTEVYGASRHQQDLREAPASVTIITADDIRKHGYRTLADILRSIPGIHVSYDRNYSYIGVRGFSQPGDYGTRVLLLVDGVRINDALYDQSSIGTEFPLDTDMIDRLEFIAGPASSLYGNSAFLGVINIRTKSAVLIGSPELAVSAASFGTYQGRLSYGGRFANGLEIVLSGTVYDSDGQTLAFDEFDQPTTNSGFTEGADGNRSYGLFAKFSLQDLTLSTLLHHRVKHIPTASYDQVFPSDDALTRDDRWLLSLGYENELSDGLTLTARTSYQNYYYRGDYIYESPPPTPVRYTNSDRADAEWLGAEAVLVGRVLDDLTLTMGGEYRYAARLHQENKDEVDPPAVYLDDDRTSRIVGAFGQADANLTQGLRFSAGVRYDDYNTFGATVNPRAAILFDPFENTALKLVYGAAFRAPNTFELYYDDGGIANKANPDLEPETIDTVELSCEQAIDDHLSASVSGFHYWIDDIIIQTVDPVDGLARFINQDQVVSTGIELGLRGRWDSGVRTRVSFSYQEAEDRNTGDWLTNSPRNLGKLNLIVPVVEGKVFAGVELQYLSRRLTVQNSTTDPVFLVNLTLFQQQLEDGLDVTASVYNLLDQKYGDPGGYEHVMAEIPQDRMSFRLQATYRF